MATDQKQESVCYIYNSSPNLLTVVSFIGAMSSNLWHESGNEGQEEADVHHNREWEEPPLDFI